MSYRKIGFFALLNKNVIMIIVYVFLLFNRNCKNIFLHIYYEYKGKVK